jgi:mycothiol system anti-sigma-R factor
MVHTCAEIVKLLSEYIDGEMDEESRAHLEAHLADCPPCDEFLAEFKNSVKLVNQIRGEKIPVEMKQRLHNFLNAEITKRQ